MRSAKEKGCKAQSALEALELVREVAHAAPGAFDRASEQEHAPHDLALLRDERVVGVAEGVKWLRKALPPDRTPSG